MHAYNIDDIRDYYSETKLGQGTVLWIDQKNGYGIIIMYHINLPIEVYFDSSVTENFTEIKRHDLLRFEVTYKTPADGYAAGYYAKRVRK